MYGETSDFQYQHSKSNIKYPIGKSNFEVNLLLKLFPAAVANNILYYYYKSVINK